MVARKGDFDHIVDSISDDEGDEEAARDALFRQEMLDEKAQLKTIITAVTEGRDAAIQQSKQGKYSHKKLLTSGRDEWELERFRNGGANAADEAEEEEEFDQEEMLQRGMEMKITRELEKDRRLYVSDDEDLDSEADSVGSDVEDAELMHMTHEEREAEKLKREHWIEQQRRENISIRQQARQNKIARYNLYLQKKAAATAAAAAVAGNLSSGTQTQGTIIDPASVASLLQPASAIFSLDDDLEQYAFRTSILSRQPSLSSGFGSRTSTASSGDVSGDVPRNNESSSCNTAEAQFHSGNNNNKRRKSSPKKIDQQAHQRRSIKRGFTTDPVSSTVVIDESSQSRSLYRGSNSNLGRSVTVTSNHLSNHSNHGFQRSSSVVAPSTSASSIPQSSSLYSGVLDQNEVLGGYGMGMGVSSRISRTISSGPLRRTTSVVQVSTLLFYYFCVFIIPCLTHLIMFIFLLLLFIYSGIQFVFFRC